VRYVLVHGAFRGGWAWDRVRPALEAAGHEVLTPTLSLEPVPSLDSWAREIAYILDRPAADGRDTVLVGHSQGGVVVLAASALSPARVSRLVLLDSPVPRPGETAADVLPDAVRASYGDPPRDSWLPPTPTGDPWVDDRLVPAPAAPAYEPVDPDGVAASLPTIYVFCSGTETAYPSSYSRRRFEEEGRDFRWLDADHDAPLRQPERVSELLLQLAVGD
jgi:pimeloyl-ACP methyl ester carboxylesterase